MKYDLIQKDSFHVFGIRRRTPDAGGTWRTVKTDGSMEQMQAIAGYDAVSLGLCFGFDDEGNNDYLCGFEYPAHEIPGFDHYTCPKSAWLVFDVGGSIADGLLSRSWKQIYDVMLPQSGYRQRDLPTVEKYLEWNEKADRCHVQIMIPIEQ